VDASVERKECCESRQRDHWAEYDQRGAGCPSRVSGVFLLEDGSPCSACSVLFYDASRAPETLVSSANTSSAGRYSWTGSLPKSVEIRFLVPSRGTFEFPRIITASGGDHFNISFRIPVIVNPDRPMCASFKRGRLGVLRLQPEELQRSGAVLSQAEARYAASVSSPAGPYCFHKKWRVSVRGVNRRRGAALDWFPISDQEDAAPDIGRHA